MKQHWVKGSVLLASLALAAAGQAQTQDGYLDVFTVRVKPDKRADFDAVIKRMVDANRKHTGSNWLASEVLYGEGNTVLFTSPVPTFGAAEKASEAFMGAMAKAGQVAALQAFNNTVVSSRSEMRRRRNDLSANVILSPEELFKKVGASRYVRTLMVRVRPGHVAEYEEQVKALTAALGRTGTMFLVSQSVAGQTGAVFYISSLVKSLAEFDPPLNVRQAMGEDRYRRYTEVIARSVLNTDSFISRYLPELSHPPEAVVSGDPAFWKPKPPAAAKAKPAQ